MIVGQYLSLSLLIVISIIHIFALFKRNRKLKSITKVFLLPLIILFYCFSTKEINWLIFTAFVCGWIGDLILIPKNKIVVPIGGIFFFAEQVILAVALGCIIDYSNIALAWVIVIPIIYAILATTLTTLGIKKSVKLPIFLFGTLYLIVNGITSAMALCLLISTPNILTGLVFLGATCFFVSDTILGYVRMTENPKFDQRHIVIMITYIIAQFLLSIGFIA